MGYEGWRDVEMQDGDKHQLMQVMLLCSSTVALTLPPLTSQMLYKEGTM
jgi:hypothetical protein